MALADSTMNLPMPPPSLSSATLPTLDFGFDDLRAHMSAFTARFDRFVEDGRRRVLEQRAEFRVRVGEVREKQSTTTQHLHTAQEKSTLHAQALASQTAEAQEMSEAISSLSSTRDAHAAHVSALQARLVSIRADLAKKRTEHRARVTYAEGMRAQNERELDVWERTLGMRVEGEEGEEDRVRFVFEGGAGGWFVLDMSRGWGVVRVSRGRVEDEEVGRLVDELGRTEELGVFLGGMRSLLLR